MTLTDVLRALAVVLGVALGTALAIIILRMRTSPLDARRQAMRWFAASYVLLLLGAVLEVNARIGEGAHVTWRSPLVVLCAALGGVGVYKFRPVPWNGRERRRKDRRDK